MYIIKMSGIHKLGTTALDFYKFHLHNKIHYHLTNSSNLKAALVSLLEYADCYPADIEYVLSWDLTQPATISLGMNDPRIDNLCVRICEIMRDKPEIVNKVESFLR